MKRDNHIGYRIFKLVLKKRATENNFFRHSNMTAICTSLVAILRVVNDYISLMTQLHFFYIWIMNSTNIYKYNILYIWYMHYRQVAGECMRSLRIVFQLIWMSFKYYDTMIIYWYIIMYYHLDSQTNLFGYHTNSAYFGFIFISPYLHTCWRKKSG